MRKSVIALSVLLGTVGFGANNASARGFFQNPAAYGGLGAANTHFDDDDRFSDLDADTSDKGVHVFGGYQFNPYLAVELSARDLGEYQATDNFNGIRYKDQFTATTIGPVGFLPLGAGFSMYGRVGIGAITLNEKATFIATGDHDKNDDTGGVSSLGAGIEYRNSGLAVRAGWESHFFTVKTTTYFSVNNGSYTYYYANDDEFHQRIDSFGLDIAYYFSL